MTRKLSFDTIFTFVGMISFQSFNFLIGVLIARFAKVEVLGSYQLFIVTTSFFGFFSKMGIDEKLSYTIPYLGGAKTEKGKGLIVGLIGKTLFYSFIASAGTILFYYLFSKFSVQGVDTDVAYYSLLYLPMFSLLLVLTSIFRAENLIKVRTLLTYFIPVFLSLLFFILFLGIFEIEIHSLIIMRTLAYTVSFSVGIYWVSKYFNLNILRELFRSFRKNSLEFDKSLYKWLIVVLATYLIETGTVGIWIIRLASDEYNLGIITIIIRLACLTYFAPTAIGIVFGPILAKKKSDNLPIRKAVIRMLIISSVLVILSSVFIFTFSSEILSVFGKNIDLYYAELNYMLLGSAVIAFTQPIQIFALAVKSIKKVMFVSFMSLLIALGVFYASLNGSTILSYVMSISYSMIAFGFIRIIYLFKV